MNRLLAGVLLVCASFAVSTYAAQPPTLAAVIEAIDNPQLGPSAKVQDVTITPSKNMTIRLASGSAASVKSGDDIFGVFFVGSGSFTYRSVDPTEAVNVKFEAKKLSDATVSADGSTIELKGEFQQMVLMAGGIALPQLTTADGTSLTDAFAKYRQDMKLRNVVPAHLLAKQKIDAPASPVAFATFMGNQDPLGYALDTVDGRNELLVALVKNRTSAIREMANSYVPLVISDQPVGRSRKDFLEPLFLLTNLDYEVTATDENADLMVNETIVPRVGAQKVFRFDLFSTIYDGNFRPRNFSVRKVSDASGKELSYDHRDGSLIVGLPDKAGVNQEVKLHFEIQGNFLVRPSGDSAWQLGVAPWFPQPDWNGQYMKVHSLVKVKKPFTAFAPGVTIRRGEEGDYNVVENRIDVPIQFAVVHAGKYFVDEKKYDDGLTIRVASYAMPNERAMKQLNNLAYKLIKFYEPWLGPFPFKEFNILEIHELGFGQAPPGTMFITKEAFNPTMGDDNKIFSQGINHRFAHEIAHQYWAHVVKMGSPEEQWVTESFAEYSSALAIKQLKGESDYKKMVATWRERANEAKNTSSIAMANRIRIPGDPQTQFRHRTFLVYDKGAYLLYTLHQQLGDSKFLTFMRTLQGIFQWKYLTTKDMAKVLDKIAPGQDWNAYFDQYFWGTEMPRA